MSRSGSAGPYAGCYLAEEEVLDDRDEEAGRPHTHDVSAGNRMPDKWADGRDADGANQHERMPEHPLFR
eukprot:94165-Rhodomonas_salina.1